VAQTPLIDTGLVAVMLMLFLRISREALDREDAGKRKGA